MVTLRPCTLNEAYWLERNQRYPGDGTLGSCISINAPTKEVYTRLCRGFSHVLSTSPLLRAIAEKRRLTGQWVWMDTGEVDPRRYISIASLDKEAFKTTRLRVWYVTLMQVYDTTLIYLWGHHGLMDGHSFSSLGLWIQHITELKTNTSIPLFPPECRDFYRPYPRLNYAVGISAALAAKTIAENVLQRILPSHGASRWVLPNRHPQDARPGFTSVELPTDLVMKHSREKAGSRLGTVVALAQRCALDLFSPPPTTHLNTTLYLDGRHFMAKRGLLTEQSPVGGMMTFACDVKDKVSGMGGTMDHTLANAAERVQKALRQSALNAMMSLSIPTPGLAPLAARHVLTRSTNDRYLYLMATVVGKDSPLQQLPRPYTPMDNSPPFTLFIYINSLSTRPGYSQVACVWSLPLRDHDGIANAFRRNVNRVFQITTDE